MGAYSTICLLQYCNNKLLKCKFSYSVEEVDTSELAYQKVANILRCFLSHLHASLSTEIDQVISGSDLNVKYVDRRLLETSMKKSYRSKNLEKLFVSRCVSCWLANHITKENLNVYQKNNALLQSTFAISKQIESDELY